MGLSQTFQRICASFVNQTTVIDVLFHVVIASASTVVQSLNSFEVVVLSVSVELIESLNLYVPSRVDGLTCSIGRNVIKGRKGGDRRWFGCHSRADCKARTTSLQDRVCPREDPTLLQKNISKFGKRVSDSRVLFLHEAYASLLLYRQRINPLRNFAFCSRFTGTKSCIYVEGQDDQKLVVVHYAVDRFFDKVRTTYRSTC